MLKTEDIAKIFVEKLKNEDYRILGGGNDKQQTRTIEIQNAHFQVDKPWIIREPNYEYAKREIEWYDSQSLNVEDIPGQTPIMWKACADKDGYINSNYGWMIYSKENGEQYKHCLEKLKEDAHTREACMIYQRPSMQEDYKKNGMHDFCCTYAVQCFINEDEFGNWHLGYTVYMRSNDAVFGFNNDALWHKTVQERLAKDLSDYFERDIVVDDIIWNASSLHIYERHFPILEKLTVLN